MQKIKTVFLNVSLILPSVMITIMVMMIIITIIIKPDNKTVTSTNEHEKNMWESLDIIQRENGGQSELFTGRLSFLWLLRFLILSWGPSKSFSNVVLAFKSTQPVLWGTGASLYSHWPSHLINVHRNHCICSKLRTQQSLSQQVRCRGLALLSCSSRKHSP